MENIHVFAFNKTLMDLVSVLEQAFPDDYFVCKQRAPLEMALSLCNLTAISEFMSQMLVHGREIDERNDAYFLDKLEGKPSVAVGAELWARMDRPLQDQVWEHIQKMKKIGTTYYLIQ